MTHDVLLHIIERHQNAQYQPDTRDITVWEILQAVVELHKPTEAYFGDEIVCGACGNEDFEWTYPCPTIRAIEKELDNASL